MLKKGIALGLFLALGAAGAAEPVSSGPQAGARVPGVFKPMNVTGPDAGKEECLYCKHGARPMVMVFARELTPGVVALIKRLDAATAARAEAGLGSCVIVLTDAAQTGPALAKWAGGEKIAHTILATYAKEGPAKYAIASDAAVTVLLYTKQTVKANHAFRAGELTEAKAATVLADLAKILPSE
jgi:hypothetical protein